MFMINLLCYIAAMKGGNSSSFVLQPQATIPSRRVSNHHFRTISDLHRIDMEAVLGPDS